MPKKYADFNWLQKHMPNCKTVATIENVEEVLILERDKVRLFMMNDYDWVAAETAEQANKWYKKELGLKDEDQPIEEVKEESMDKVFLTPVKDLTDADRKNNFRIKLVGHIEFAEIPFSYILATTKKIDEPFLAGSTEY